jgi:hypothetical protein
MPTLSKRPIVEFCKLPLSLTVRRRLASIEDSRHRHPQQKMALADRLLSCAKDVERGLYVPLVSYPWVPRKITEDFSKVPQHILASDGTPLSFFCNALLLPADVLEVHEAPCGVQPIRRITNPGFVVVTIEHDPTDPAGFEDCFQWTAKDGKLFELDKELRQYRDYDGFCAVWSGNKSVHFHFVFDTTHLLNAPFEQSASQRWATYAQQAAVMAIVHRRYFDHLAGLVSDICRPSVRPDMKLRSHSQFRRMPWGLRRIEKDSIITGLKAGTVVPQLVLAEKIRSSRAAKGSSSYLIPSDITVERRDWSPRSGASPSLQLIEPGDKIINELARMCWTEWSREYPKPVRMWQDRGEWVINFKNHQEDQNPATVCRGGHDHLLVQGRGAPEEPLALPGGLTADELGDYLGLQFGLIKPSQVASLEDKEVDYFERLKEKSGRPFKDLYEEGFRNRFPERSSGSIAELQTVYREKLKSACASVRSFNSHAIILSAEGIGKTKALSEIMANEALDTALSPADGRIRFNAFAFRSELQAAGKIREYQRDTGCTAFLWRSFWNHYADACRMQDQNPIPKAKFDNETDILAILNQMKREQPTVFDQLEEVRRTQWVDDTGRSTFSSNTMLFTTHATVMSWVEARVTRSWHHPDFDPSITADELAALREQMILQDVVFDEPEFGELLWVLTAELHAHLSGVKQWDWKGPTVVERRELFHEIRLSGAIPSDMSFESYSELRYLDLDAFQRVEVDFSAQPFGRENSPHSIYRRWHETPFYLGVKRWPFSGSARITYLTTEAFTAEAIAAVYKRAAKPLFTLRLDELPTLYPIHVSVVKDKRVRAQSIQDLVLEILASSETAVVVADGLSELNNDRTMTFQAVKGHNGLADKDIFVAVTFLAPEVYAELNVLGQWTGQQDTVAKYYCAQISQAIGRNTGFRQKAGTKTVLVISGELLRQIRPQLEKLDPRFVLQPVPERMW